MTHIGNSNLKVALMSTKKIKYMVNIKCYISSYSKNYIVITVLWGLYAHSYKIYDSHNTKDGRRKYTILRYLCFTWNNTVLTLSRKRWVNHAYYDA